MRFTPKARHLLLLCGLSAAACKDGAPPPTASPDDAPVQAFRALADNEINRDDTYYTADVSNSGSVQTTFDTPVTGADGQPTYSITFPYPTETSSLDIGYGYDDQLRSTLTGTLGRITSVGDWVNVYDPAGNLRTSRSISDALSALGPLPVALPSMNNAEVLGGAIMDSVAAPGGDCGPAVDHCHTEPGYTRAPTDGASFAQAPTEETAFAHPRAGPKVERPSGDRLRMTVLSGPEGGASTIVRTFRKHGRQNAHGKRRAYWVLEEVETTKELQHPSGGRVRMHMVQRFRHVRFNVSEEHERRRWKVKRDRIANSGTAAPVVAAPPASSLRALARGWEPQLSALSRRVPTGLQRETTAPPRSTGTPTLNVAAASGSPFLIYQHGLRGVSGTWAGMRTAIQGDFAAFDDATQIPDTEVPVPWQAVYLRDEVLARGAPNNVLIGHSLGGLLSRRVGQMIPGQVSGVVTIGSPNIGAHVAIRPPAENVRIIRETTVYGFGGRYCRDGLNQLFVCEFINVSADILTGLLADPTLLSDFPSRTDLKPGSAFLDSLNNRYEPFQRAGIESAPSPRWVAFRMAGDGRTPVTQLNPRGEEWVDDADFVYQLGGWAIMVGHALMYYHPYSYGCSWYDHMGGYCDPFAGWHGPGGYYYGRSNFWWRIGFFLMEIGYATQNGMNAADRAWDYVTTGGMAYRGLDETDGFIARSSQRYPDVPGAHVPLRRTIKILADSHLGETHSPEVRVALRDVLGQFGVPRRQF